MTNLQFVLKYVLDEFGHDSLRAREHLPHLLVDLLTQLGSVLEHITPHVRPLDTHAQAHTRYPWGCGRLQSPQYSSVVTQQALQ